MTPYYSEGGITIYHGDCREILPTLAKADLVLTDPPYGIAAVWKGSDTHGWHHRSAERVSWDGAPPAQDLIELVVASGDHSVIWGGNYFALPVSRGWLVWNKPERNFSLSEAELAWTNRDAVIRVFDCVRSDVGREHPTQKPLSLMRWCLTLFPEAKTVIDPFMGSGTTLRAAKDLGRRVVGIEMEERYCALAAKRLQQEVLALEDAS